MTDWATIASVATATGTMVLAVATYSSVRSANRSTRIAEKSLELSLQPVLVPSRPEDPPERVTFMEGFAIEAPGGGAAIQARDGNLFVVIPLRNVGSGLAVLRSGHVAAGRPVPDATRPNTETFRQLQRDIYVPPGDLGYWQIGIRAGDDPFHDAVDAAARDGHAITVTLMYSNHFGGHETVSQFIVARGEDDAWITSGTRHWGIGHR
jgi:hypothetical protein